MTATREHTNLHDMDGAGNTELFLTALQHLRQDLQPEPERN
jgi:hypothetical protein